MKRRIDNSPPMWGEYKSATAYYASEKWLNIVRFTLNNHRITLGLARRAGNREAIDFYSKQVKACERELGLTPAQPEATPAQQSLFNSLLR